MRHDRKVKATCCQESKHLAGTISAPNPELWPLINHLPSQSCICSDECLSHTLESQPHNIKYEVEIHVFSGAWFWIGPLSLSDLIIIIIIIIIVVWYLGSNIH